MISSDVVQVNRTHGIDLLITTKCNMQCRHCLLSCTEDGEDMDLRTIDQAISWATILDCGLHLGGGEPTIHPRFWDILALCLRDSSARGHVLSITTNGSMTETTLILAQMAKAGRILLRLSIDQWHAPIDSQVVNAFNGANGYPNYRAGDLRVKTMISEIWQQGRGADLPPGNYELTNESCPCSMRTVYPNGDVTACGCIDAPVAGSVFDTEPVLWNHSGCSMGRM